MNTDKVPILSFFFFFSEKKDCVEAPVCRTDWLLRIGVLIYTMGLAAAIFSWSGSAIGGIALMEWGIAPGQILIGERIVVSILLLGALTLLIYPTSIVLIIICGVAFLESYAVLRFGGVPFAEYTPLAHGLRYLAPLALIPLVASNSFFTMWKWQVVTATWVLRIGLACVFFAHGLEALWLNPGFIDLIIGSAWNLIGVTISEATASVALRIIGTVDIVVACLVLVRPWRPILVWMFFWALITALSRPVAFGFASYPEVLLRASHMIAPIALWWLIYSEVKEASSKRMADNSSTYV